jgi:two-component SAPR family response regulator
MARIVIVDDDVAMDILLQRLRYCSHDVERHGSLEDALAHMEALVAADLVILDISSVRLIFEQI